MNEKRYKVQYFESNMGDTQSKKNGTETLDGNMGDTQSSENNRTEILDGNMGDTQSTENSRTETVDGNMGDTKSTENGRTGALNGNMGDIQSTENGRTGTLDAELGNFQCNLPHDLPMKDERKISGTYQSIKNGIRRTLSFKKVKKKESDLDINIETNDITIKEIQTTDATNQDMESIDTTRNDTNAINAICEDIGTIKSASNDIEAVINNNDIDTIDSINKGMQSIGTIRKYIGSIISTIKRIVTINPASSNIGTSISANNDIQTIDPITKEMQSIDTTSKDVDMTNSTIKDSLNMVNHHTEPIVSSNNNIAPIHPINMGICTLDEININVIAESAANENITPERSGSTPARQDRNVTLHESDITSKSSVTSQQKHSETRLWSRSDNNLDNREYEEKIKQNRIRKNFYYILSRTPSSLARRSLSHMPLASLFEDVSIALVMIQQCSPVIVSLFSAWLKIAPSDWLKTFLERNGLSIILRILISSTSRKKDFAEAILDLMVIQCVKRILNSRVGMTYLIDGNLVREFSSTMDTGNLMVKNQVLELWSGVCLYSNDGYQLLLSTLDHFKVEKNQRYRFSIIINELRNTDLLGYKTTVLAFINAFLIATEDFNQRRNMRNEFIGLGLLEELQLLRYKDNVDDDLLVQIEVFDEYKLKDDDAMISAGGFNLNNHEDVFKAIFHDVAERPEANNFLNILQNLLMINEDNAVSHIVWQSIEDIVRQAVLACNKDQVAAIKQRADGEVEKMKNSLNENEKLSEFDESQKYGISAGFTHQADSEKSSLESKRFTADFSMQTEDTSKIGGYGVPEETGFPPIHPPLPPLFPGMPHPPPAEEMGVSPAHPHPSPPEMGAPPPPSLPEICVPPPRSPVGVGALLTTPPSVIGAPPPPIPPPEMGVPTSTPPPLGMCVPHPLPPLGTVVPPPPPPPVNGLPPPPLPPPGMGVPPRLPFPPIVHGTPQPPPLPGMAVLPPPPPHGGMGSIPSSPDLMPPLPPSMGQRSVSCPGAIKPHVKMKKLQWNKIPKNMLNRSKSSVWTKVMAVSAIDPDYDIEEKLFCQPVIEKAKPKGETKNVPKYITLLDGKTSMSVNIFLRQFKGGPAQVITWIKDGRSKELEGDRLRCLEKLLPEPNVIEELKAFTGDKEKLGPAEKFFLQLLDLPVYKFRISTLILKEDFQTSTESLRPNIDIMKTAINDIISNEVLPELLDLILRVGNFLNYGSHAGNAEAFKITSLLKLTDTRANKPRMNLLHFIVQMAKEKRERLLEFPLKMPKLAEASRLSVENLEGEVGELKKSLETVSKKISKFSDDIKEQFGEFIEDASDECGILETSVKEIRQLAFDLAEYLCEDPKKFVLEDNLKVFQQFSEALVKAKEENEQFERLEERKRKQEEKAAEEKVRREKLGIKDEPKKGRGKIPPPKEEKCIIDSLLDEVKKGFPLKKLNMKRDSMGEQMPYQIQRKESGQSERFEPKVQKWRAIALLLATVPK